MTSTDENKRTIEDLIERLFSHGDMSAVEDHVDDGFVFHDPPPQICLVPWLLRPCRPCTRATP